MKGCGGADHVGWHLSGSKNDDELISRVQNITISVL